MDSVVLLLVVVVLVVAVGFVIFYRWPATPISTTDDRVAIYPRTTFTYPSSYYYNSYPYSYVNPYRRYSTGLLY